MAKGYWMAHVDVQNAEVYKEYVARNGVAFSKFGGRFLVRAGAFEERGQPLDKSRHVCIEFPSYQAALDCYASPEYQHALEAQKGAATVSLVIVEGYDG
ncbi:MAG: DUF1330 domain-containing protein [Pseudomonadota bacterium]